MGHVATRVWDILKQEGFLREHTGIIFSGQEVMGYRDEKHEYFFVPMDTAICLDYPRFLPEMNQYFLEAVFTTWNNEAFGVSHILANQWLVSGEYENESGFKRASDCIHAIAGGVEAIFFHDKLKAVIKI